MHEAVWTRDDALAFLEHPGRRDSENPDELWKRAALAPGMTVVDVGAGSGFFALPAARIVGPGGRVFAVDVSPQLVDLVRERATDAHLANLETVRSRPNHIPLPDSVADRVLLANVVHGVAPTTLQEAVRVLGPGGRLLDLDWKKEDTPEGPPVAHRLSVAEAVGVFERLGLRAIMERDLGPYHYLLAFEKPRKAPSRPERPSGRFRNARRSSTTPTVSTHVRPRRTDRA